MRKSTKLLILTLSLLLMVALVPTLANAATTDITRVEITDMEIPYYGGVASYTSKLQCKISASSTDVGSYIEQNILESGWFPEGSDYHNHSENRIKIGDQFLEDVYYHASIGAPAGYGFPASFTAAQIVCTQLKCKPYRIEITGRTTDGISISLHFHPIFSYSGDSYKYIDIYGYAFPTEVIDGQVPNKTDYEIDACGHDNHFTISNINWTEKGSNINTSKFVAGKNYEVQAVLTPDDRYATFGTTDLNKIINSNSITVAGELVGDSDRVKVEWKTAGKSLLITYCPDTAVKEVSEVSLSGVQQPQIGGTPQKDGFTTTTDGASVALYKWFIGNKEFTGTFAADTTYTLCLRVTPKKGFCLLSDVSKMAVTANAGTVRRKSSGRPDGDAGAGEANTLYVSIEFKTGAAPVTPAPEVTPTPTPAPDVTPVPETTPVPAEPTSASDDTGSYTIANGTATFTGPKSKKVKTLTIPASVKAANGKEYPVTAIGEEACYGLTKLTKVTIPASVTTIGKEAFASCAKLKTVSGGKGLVTIGQAAFKGDKKLSAITLYSKVKNINKQAFYGCKGLKTITIKTKLLTSDSVGSKAFKGIYSKATIKCPKTKLSSYKKILKKKGVPSTAKFKK